MYTVSITAGKEHLNVFITVKKLLLGLCLDCLGSRWWVICHLRSMEGWIREVWLKVYPVQKRSEVNTEYRSCSKDRSKEKHGSGDHQAWLENSEPVSTTCVLCPPKLKPISLSKSGCGQLVLSDLGPGLSFLCQLYWALQMHTEVVQQTQLSS